MRKRVRDFNEEAVNFRWRVADSESTATYICLREAPVLTVIVGAKCKDEIALVADRKLTDFSGGPPQFREKVFGDFAHILIGYTGKESTFDLFRKYIVGENVLTRQSSDPYTFDNVIPKASSLVERFNLLVKKREYQIELLVAPHKGKN